MSLLKIERNRPVLEYHAKLAKVEMPKLHLSVSHDGEYVISYVIAEQLSS